MQDGKAALAQQVRVILQAASSSRSATEAAIAVLDAHEFVETHQLNDAGLLPEAVATDGLVVQREVFPVRRFRRTPWWLHQLLVSVSSVTQTRFGFGRIDLGPLRYGFQGLDLDTEAAAISLQYLITQMEVQLFLRQRGNLCLKDKRRYSHSYRNGFSSSVMNNAMSLAERRKSSAPRVELAQYKRHAIEYYFGPGTPGRPVSIRDIVRRFENLDERGCKAGNEDGKRAQFSPGSPLV